MRLAILMFVLILLDLQLFALNNTLLSIVELPAQDGLGGGVTTGFATSPTLVRIILRDLSGKASWDVAHLHAPPSPQGNNDILVAAAAKIKFGIY